MYPLYIVYSHLSSTDDISCYFVIFCVIYLFDAFPFHPHVYLLVLFHNSFPKKAQKITYCIQLQAESVGGRSDSLGYGSGTLKGRELQL